MAIETTITKISRDARATVVTMLFSDNVSIKQEFDFRLESFNLEAFKAQVRSKRDSLLQVDAVKVTLVEGPFDPSPAPPAPPTAEEKDITKFVEDLNLLRHMVSAISLKIKDAGDPDYVGQIDLVKQQLEAHPEYIALCS